MTRFHSEKVSVDALKVGDRIQCNSSIFRQYPPQDVTVFLKQVIREGGITLVKCVEFGEAIGLLSEDFYWVEGSREAADIPTQLVSKKRPKMFSGVGID